MIQSVHPSSNNAGSITTSNNWSFNPLYLIGSTAIALLAIHSQTNNIADTLTKLSPISIHESLASSLALTLKTTCVAFPVIYFNRSRLTNYFITDARALTYLELNDWSALSLDHKAAALKIVHAWKNNDSSLDLSHSKITSIPKCLSGNLHYLTDLNLSNNQLSNLAGLENCLRLTKIDVSHNLLINIENVIPLLGKGLKEFISGGNPMSLEIRSLTNDCPEINPWITKISESPAWKNPDLRQELSNRICQVLEFALNNPAYRKNLASDLEEVSNESPLQMLKILDLKQKLFLWASSSSEDLSSASAEIIFSYKNKNPLLLLENLKLSSWPENITEYLEHVTQLFVSNNQFSDSQWLKNFPNLTLLKIKNNQLSNLNGIEHCLKLKKLDVSLNLLTNMKAVVPLLNNCLKDFIFESNPMTLRPDIAENLLEIVKSANVKQDLQDVDIRQLADLFPDIYKWIKKITESPHWEFSEQRKTLASNILQMSRIATNNSDARKILFNHIGTFLSNKNKEIPDHLSAIYLELKLLNWKTKVSENTDVEVSENTDVEEASKRIIEAMKPGRATLDLSGLKIASFPKQLLVSLKNIKNLILNNNNFSNLNFLEDCPDLIHLSIINNSITDMTGAFLCQKLTYLDLQNNKITKLPDLTYCEKMDYLNVDGNPIINSAFRRSPFKKYPKVFPRVTNAKANPQPPILSPFSPYTLASPSTASAFEAPKSILMANNKETK